MRPKCTRESYVDRRLALRGMISLLHVFGTILCCRFAGFAYCGGALLRREGRGVWTKNIGCLARLDSDADSPRVLHCEPSMGLYASCDRTTNPQRQPGTPLGMSAAMRAARTTSVRCLGYRLRPSRHSLQTRTSAPFEPLQRSFDTVFRVETPRRHRTMDCIAAGWLGHADAM